MRFVDRLRAHSLKVEPCKWLGGSNICDKPKHTFARLPNTDFIPFLASFHSITDPEINAFLHQDSSTSEPV
eukprot:106493-Pelagomonas_calceolata.AAC.1